MSDISPQKTLLIIDDDEALLRSLSFGLRPERWRCLPFSTWREARDAIAEGIVPDVGIVDLHLARDLPSNGIDVIGCLTDQFPELPIVALTGHPDYQDAAKRCIDAGALQFVRKPAEIAELEERLLQAVLLQEHYRKSREAELAEKQAAARIQGALFPKHCPNVAEMEIQEASKPAAVVSGDFYDYVSFPRAQRVLIAIGDAMHHGLPAALNAHVVGGAWRALTRTEGEAPDPAQMLGLINEIVFDGGGQEALMTLLILRLNVQTQHMDYANAGHPCPIVFRGAETPQLEGSGPMLGQASRTVYKNRHICLQEGDLLLLYSDGLTDVEIPAEEGQTQILGRDGLVREVRSLLRQGTRDLPARLLRHLLKQSGKERFDDDCTAVTIEVERSATSGSGAKRTIGFDTSNASGGGGA